MLFDSPIYFIFLIAVALAYWRLSHHAQNVFLLLASYFFYGWWDWRFLALMIGSTTVDFLFAQKIAESRPNRNRKPRPILLSDSSPTTLPYTSWRLT